MKKLLLIDDSPDILTLMKIAFKNFPEVEIDSVTDPRDALAKAESFQPDLCLIDFKMPHLSGPQVFKGLKRLASLSHTQLYFLTGSDDPKEMRSLTGLRPAGVLKKPFSIRHIANEILKAYEANHCQEI